MIKPLVVDIKRGDSVQFQVGHWEKCCSDFKPTPEKVVWTIRPETAGKISADGTLTVSPAAKPGLWITILARLASSLEFEAHAVVYPYAIKPLSANVKPGDSIRFQVGQWECCYVFRPAPEKAAWTIRPETAGNISSDGTLTVSPEAEPGLWIMILARLDIGLELEAHAVVYTSESNPLVGRWYETRQLLCNGQVRDAPEPFRELIFEADGSFSVTWEPFEVYHDYWGTYSYDVHTNALQFSIASGNYIPKQTDLVGTVVVMNPDELHLVSIFLGCLTVAKSSQQFVVT
ncbi:hypothetical protein HYR54_03825 [Candidatus Acetothermia bacterium]|nr:hypothetical protein [Candidatus Acetothermia bacterium]